MLTFIFRPFIVTTEKEKLNAVDICNFRMCPGFSNGRDDGRSFDAVRLSVHVWRFFNGSDGMRYYEKIIDAEWEEIPPVAIRSDAQTCALRSDGRRLWDALLPVVITVAVSLLIGRILGFFIYGKIL